MQNKIKITTIITTLLIGIMMFSPTTIVPKVDAQTATQPEAVPAAPTTIGCYHYTTGASWTSVSCATPEETKNLLPPTIGSIVWCTCTKRLIWCHSKLWQS